MYSLGCYSSNFARQSSTYSSKNCQQSDTYVSISSQSKQATSFENMKMIPENNSPTTSACVRKLSSGQTSKSSLASSVRNPSANAKTSDCYVTPSSRNSGTVKKLPARSMYKNFALDPSTQTQTDAVFGSGSQRSKVSPKKLLVAQSSSTNNENGKKKTCKPSSSSASIRRREQPIAAKKVAISSCLGNPHVVLEPSFYTSLPTDKIDNEIKSETPMHLTASFPSLNNHPSNASSFTSPPENMSSSAAAPDNYGDLSSYEKQSLIDDDLECTSSFSSCTENQSWSKPVKKMSISTSGCQTVIHEAPEYISTSGCERLESAAESEHTPITSTAHLGRLFSAISTESSDLDVKLLPSTSFIDDQRAENEVSKYTTTSQSSELFLCEAARVPSSSLFSDPLESCKTVAEQQKSCNSQLFNNDASKVFPTRIDTEPELEFFDSHFAFAETELNSTNLSKLLPVFEDTEIHPIVTPTSSCECQIFIGKSYHVDCINMAEPYSHLKSILKTTTKYPLIPKKTLSIQAAIAWYISYYWNYSKSVTGTTAGETVRASSQETVHRAKINDGRAVLEEDELNDGGYFSDSKPENYDEIRAQVEVMKRVSFAEPMVTTVHHYVGVQKPKRTSPDVNIRK